MMNEIWIAVLVGIVPSAFALVGSIGAILFAVNERRARVEATEAGAGKTRAETDAITSGEWRELYDQICIRVEEQDINIRLQEAKLDKQNVRLDKMAHRLDIARDYIQYLWMVVVTLTNQLHDAGLEPEAKPDRTFRGGDDDYIDDEDWKWIEGSMELGDKKA